MTDPEHAPHKWRFRADKWFGGLCFFFVVFIIIQNTTTNNRVEEQSRVQVTEAQDQAQCNQEFMRVIKERSALTTNNDALDDIDRKATFDLVLGLTEIKPGENREQVVQEYVARFKDTLTGTAKQRELNAQERANNPYPDPRCE